MWPPPPAHAAASAGVQDQLLTPALDLVARVRGYMEDQVGARGGGSERPMKAPHAASRDCSTGAGNTAACTRCQRCRPSPLPGSVASQVLGALMGDVLRPFPRLLAAARDQGQELLREQEARARAHVELMIS